MGGRDKRTSWSDLVGVRQKVGNLTGVKDLTNSKSDHEGHSTIDIKAIIKMILKTIIPNS